jgi:hypothetical protein
MRTDMAGMGRAFIQHLQKSGRQSLAQSLGECFGGG